jgi:hypothetical protein
MRAAVSLLPEAIRQAKPQPKRGTHPVKPGTPARLRLIARLAMRSCKSKSASSPKRRQPPLTATQPPHPCARHTPICALNQDLKKFHGR